MVNKKKVIFISLAIAFVIVLLAAGVYIFRHIGGNDIFYYNNDDRRLEKAIKEHKSDIQENAFEYMKNNYSAEYGFPDASKLSYNMDNIYAEYKWDYESMLGFMKAKNKADFIKELELESVWIPVYYNDKPLGTHYISFNYNKENDRFEYTADNKYNDYSFGDKPYVEKVLLSNYEVLHTAKIGEFCFILVQKDGEDFAVYVDESYFFGLEEIDYNAKMSDPIYQEFRDWFNKKKFTVAEIEYICKIIQETNIKS